MDIDVIEIRSKTRNFVIEFLEGFTDFTNQDKFSEMGIVTDDFVLSLIQFIENNFSINISGDDGEYFFKNNLSINSIVKFIQKRLAALEVETIKTDGSIVIERDSLINDIMSCIINVVGRTALEIDVDDDLIQKSFWDELETELPGQLFEKFKIEFDFTTFKSLTLYTIADYITHEQPGYRNTEENETGFSSLRNGDRLTIIRSER